MDERPTRILLVEDDDDDYFLTRELVADIGNGRYSLDRAKSYEDGLKVMRQNRHDIYLLDYRLNGRTGVELMREVLAEGCQAPMILLTGQGEREVDIEAMKAGAVDFLTKGRIDSPLLERSIRYALERHRDQQALRQAHDDLEQRVHKRTAELERANEALREGESRYRGMFEQAAVGMANVGTDGRWLRVNQRLCDIMGYGRDELLQCTFQDVTYPDDLETALGLFRRLIDGEIHNYSLEKRYVRKDGSLVWVNLTVALQRDDYGVPQYCISVVEDISQRKQAEEALREAYRRKDQFLSMLAHELRNPLAPIRTGLEVLKLAACDRRALEKARAMMERQVGHMTRIVDDLLDVSRVNNGKLALKPERLDLGRLVRVVTADHRPAFDQAGIVLQTEAPETPVWVTADPTRLTQVMDNLLMNAAKFTDQGCRVGVRLAADQEGRHAVLTVWDTGVGLDQEMAPRLFEAFAQSDRSLARAGWALA
jgi:PAS domain S-box-containing protein